jgi:hypothetical protein
VSSSTPAIPSRSARRRSSHLVVAGTVEAVDDAANEVRLDVAVVEAPVTEE